MSQRLTTHSVVSVRAIIDLRGDWPVSTPGPVVEENPC